MTLLKEEQFTYCKEYGFIHWVDALMQPLQRGSRVRVKPIRQMMDSHGYVKKVVVMREPVDVWFDKGYVLHYKEVTGVDWIKLWNNEVHPMHMEPVMEECEKKELALRLMTEWLQSSTIVLSEKNPRHSLLSKFKTYLQD